MRNWEGLRQDLSDTGGDHFTDLRGVSWEVEGQLQRRPGLTYLTDTGGVEMTSYRGPDDVAYVVIINSAGSVEEIAL